MKFVSLIVLSGLLTVSCAHKKCSDGSCAKKEKACCSKEKSDCKDDSCKKS